MNEHVAAGNALSDSELELMRRMLVDAQRIGKFAHQHPKYQHLIGGLLTSTTRLWKKRWKMKGKSQGQGQGKKYKHRLPSLFTDDRATWHANSCCCGNV